MEEKVNQFKDYWNENQSFVSMELCDLQIVTLIDNSQSIAMACSLGMDYCLSNDISEVQE